MKPPATPVPDDEDGRLMCRCSTCFGLAEGKDLRWLRSALVQALLAGVLLGIAYTVRQYDHTATVRGRYVYRWIFLVCLCIFVYIAGRLVNWVVFRGVSMLALVPVLSDGMFYCLALDGMVQHLTWIIVGVSDIGFCCARGLTMSGVCDVAAKSMGGLDSSVIVPLLCHRASHFLTSY